MCTGHTALKQRQHMAIFCNKFGYYILFFSDSVLCTKCILFMMLINVEAFIALVVYEVSSVLSHYEMLYRAAQHIIPPAKHYHSYKHKYILQRAVHTELVEIMGGGGIITLPLISKINLLNVISYLHTLYVDCRAFYHNFVGPCTIKVRLINRPYFIVRLTNVVLLQKTSRYHKFLNLAGPLVDLCYPGITIMSFCWHVRYIPHTSQNLDSLQNDMYI